MASNYCMKMTLMPSLLGAVFALGFPTSQAATLNDYLIIGQYVNDTAVDVSNYELGKVSSLQSPTIDGPGVAPTTSSTPTYDGDIAVTSTSGTVKLSDVNVYGTIGIDCAASYNACTDSGNNLSNTNYNDSTISSSNGINGGVDLSGLNAEIAALTTFVAGLSATGSIATSSGVISSNTVVNLSSGVSVFDFSGTGGNDIEVNNDANLIFQGAADAFAVVLVNDNALFKVSNGNLLIGDGGILSNNVVIISQTSGTGANIDLSNANINGVALWDLGGDLANISLDNVSGCTQLLGDDVDIQNVRLSQCAFNTTVVPIPAAAWLFGSALLGLGWMRRKA